MESLATPQHNVDYESEALEGGDAIKTNSGQTIKSFFLVTTHV